MSDAIATITLKHWGNSLAMRMPAAVVHALKLQEDSRLYLSVEAGRVVLEPVADAPDLDDLVARITRENRHTEVGTGRRRGQEAW